MSRRIACLALAVATLIATSALAAPQSHARAPRHGVHKGIHHGHTPHHRHGKHHRQLRRHGHAPVLGAIGDQVLVDAPAANVATAVVIANPPLYFDPSWRLCQLDPSLDGHAELCGPYSYYPFGPYGYRPFGVYRPVRDYRDAPAAYVAAPGARIIRIEPKD
jgi:hypothetical protein